MASNPALEGALALTAYGIAVLRLKSGEKVPDTRHGLKDAVRDPAAVTAMFAAHPDANVGARTGAESNLVVLDIDTRHGGDRSLAAFQARHGALPATVTCATGGGGSHQYYRHPGERIGNRAGVRAGLDVRGDGGYVVVPPSVHPSGTAYTWVPGRAPGEIEFADLPPALLKLMTTRAQSIEQRAAKYVARCEPAAEGNRNQSAFKLAGNLHAIVSNEGDALDDETVLALMRTWNARNVPPLEEDELLRCIENSAKNGTPPEPKVPKRRRSADSEEPRAPAVLPSHGTRNRPTLLMCAGELDDVASECITRLAAESPPVAYVRHGALATLVPYIGPQPIGSRRIRMRINELNDSALCDLLNNRNSFHVARKNPNTGEITFHPTDCPTPLAKWMRGRAAWPRIPPLTALLTAPMMIPGGEIVAAPGYHRKSGLYLDIREGEFPSIPLEPSMADAEQALRDHILPLYAEFPFVSEAARSVAVSGLFTGVLRFAFPTSPLHCFDAPMTASGKTLIAEANGVAIQGYPASPISYAGTEDEFEKRVASALMGGTQVALIDNIRRALGGDKLCSAITSTAVSVRRFYTQVLVDIPTWGTTWYATGNNLELDKDASSRALRCRIDSGMENPAQREFKIQQLRGHVLQHRGEIIRAVLTCARAYIVAGSPKQPFKQLNRFEGWSDLPRSTMAWLGLADPVATMESTTDPETQQLSALLSALRKEFGDAAFTAAQAIDRASLKATLDVVCRARSGNGHDARLLGQVLQRGKGRVVGGHRLVLASRAHGTNSYRVEDVQASGGRGGTGGTDSTYSSSSSEHVHARAHAYAREEEGVPTHKEGETVPPVQPVPPRTLSDLAFGGDIPADVWGQ